MRLFQRRLRLLPVNRLADELLPFGVAVAAAAAAAAAATGDATTAAANDIHVCATLVADVHYTKNDDHSRGEGNKCRWSKMLAKTVVSFFLLLLL